MTIFPSRVMRLDFMPSPLRDGSEAASRGRFFRGKEVFLCHVRLSLRWI